MGRGRPKSVSDDRLLIELLIHQERAVFTSELADDLPVTPQTVRERMSDLESEGLVTIKELDNGNLYRLSDDGMDYLIDLLRSEFD